MTNWASRRLRRLVPAAPLAMALVGWAWLAGDPGRLELPQAASHVASDAWLLDRHGVELARIRLDATQRRLEWTPLEQLSPALRAALLAAEDRRFERHGGVDALALAAAARDALVERRWPRGASTITMQLAGLLLAENGKTGPEPQKRQRSLLQKWQQMRGAWQLERHYGKAQILEAYVNRVGFRGELQGVAAASWALFDKAPAALNMAESALLAAAIRAPQAPAARVAARACRLLADAALAGAEPQADCARARWLAERLRRPGAAAPPGMLAPHAARRLLRQPGERVTSTLDALVQRQARALLAEQMRELAAQGVEDGAVVVLDNASGAVLAYVGSSGAAFSRAALVDAAGAPRQAGSTLKPFLYALALDERRITAASRLDDSPLSVSTGDGQFSPRNYARQYAGWVSARVALAASLNVPAVRVLGMTELERFVGLLRALGLSSIDRDGDYYGHSLALGSADVRLLELTNAYRALANGGRPSPLRWRAEELAAAPQAAAPPVLSPQAAYVVADMLADNEARSLSFGADSVLRLPFWAAVKTGTSKDMRDNWCIGFSSRYTVGVWVGNASGAPMRDVSGVHGAAPIWHELMRRLHAGLPPPAPEPPPGLVRRAVRFDAGALRGVLAEPPRQEWFLVGTEQRDFAVADLQKRLRAPANDGPSAMETIAAAELDAARFVSPLDGAVYAIDPDVPPARQRLQLAFNAPARAALAAGSLRLLLDGRPLDAAQAERPGWLLAPGAHRLELVDADGRRRDQRRFEVRAPARP